MSSAIASRGADDPEAAEQVEEVVRSPSNPSELTRARREAGLTTTQLARRLHLSRPTVSMWEHGARPVPRYHWTGLGQALGLDAGSVQALFTDAPQSRLDGVRLPGLASRRRAAGLSGRAAARHVGVAPSTLSMWETAGVPTPRHVVDVLARLLECDLEDLVTAPADDDVDVRALRKMRRSAHMTCREAAAHLSIAVGTLARYEAGTRQVPVSVLRRMALIYRRPTSDLLALRRDHAPRLPARPWGEGDLPQVIRAYREQTGLTKVDLGRLVHRSGQAVRTWESGLYRPPPAVLRRLEAVLRLPAGHLDL